MSHLGTPGNMGQYKEVCQVVASQANPKEVTQMVRNRKQRSSKTRSKPGGVLIPQLIPGTVAKSAPYGSGFQGRGAAELGRQGAGAGGLRRPRRVSVPVAGRKLRRPGLRRDLLGAGHSRKSHLTARGNRGRSHRTRGYEIPGAAGRQAVGVGYVRPLRQSHRTAWGDWGQLYRRPFSSPSVSATRS
jgi:hypothetical protein